MGEYEFLVESLSEVLGKTVVPLKITALSGGSINRATKVILREGTFFVKWNHKTAMFDKEIHGLQLLHNTGAVNVPNVIGLSEIDKYSFLVLSYISPGIKSGIFWENLGLSLAALHRISADFYGLEEHNFIGSLPQSNAQNSDWVQFFIKERLLPLINRAFDRKLLRKVHVQLFDNLYLKLPEILSVEPGSLLHGDLWNGNILAAQTGEAVLIDPAVYFGNREMDLAMTRLFGGFDPLFYDTYLEDFPCSTGLEDRMEVYNLYPLLVHLNLFGEGYLGEIELILKRFV